MSEISIYIKNKHIQLLHGVGPSRATLIMQHIKDALNKGKNGLITITEYCQYHEVNQTEIETRLAKYFSK